MKKRILFILALILIVFILIAIAACTYRYKELTVEVGTIDIDGFDKVRYADELIVYTDDVERNEYGYEILVEKESNCIIEIADTVEISDGTYVISGHGDAADFLQTLNLGDIVDIDDGTLTVERNLFSSNLKAIEFERTEVRDIISYKRENLYDLNYSEIERIEEQIEKAILDFKLYFIDPFMNEEGIKEKYDQAINLIDRQYYLTLEQSAVEGRGIWHRPNASAIKENDLDGVKAFVKSLKKLGINTLFVETYWRGMTTYYSDYLGVQHPRMKGKSYGEYGDDYILALISECHKEDIEVHAWVELLSGGGADSGIANFKEEWICSDLEGNCSYFVDPSNPELREHLRCIIHEMLEKYEFDGISYDYIRYDETTDYGAYMDCGFTEYSVSRFSEEYGYTGNDLVNDLKDDIELRQKWHSFKQNAVTETVKCLSEYIRNKSPETIISASPYGYIDQAKSTYMQDIVAWIENGYLDLVLPMIYTENEELFSSTAREYSDISYSVLQYSGISPIYNGDTIRKNQSLVNEIKELGISGVSLFATQNYITRNSEFSEELLIAFSVFSYEGKTARPTDEADKIISAWKAMLLDRCERIYFAHMTQDEIEDILHYLSEINDFAAVSDVLSTLNKLRSSALSYSDSAVSDRIIYQIDYVSAILEASILRNFN